MVTSSPPTLFAFETTKIYQAIRPETQDGLKAFCQSGNLKHREKQVAEWLKSLEWLSWEEVSSSLQKLPSALIQSLKQDFMTYQKSLLTVKEKQSEHRKQYQLNVMDYFKENMPPSDKALLESLRDYELNLTGRDANWQHHFSFKSFKKIDAFIQATREQRILAIQAFQQDVQTYVKNKEKWQRLAYLTGEESPCFDFDDWCDWVTASDEAGQDTKYKSQEAPAHPTKRLNPTQLAYDILEMSPEATSALTWDTIKKQFRLLTLKYHPDMPTGNTTKMAKILEAYAFLKNQLKP